MAGSSPLAPTRVLVSRPLGGLNDTFCQIQKALHFAEETGRHLFLDTQDSGLLGPFDDFFEFVGDHSHVTIGFPEQALDDWDGLDVSPPELTGRIREFFACPLPDRYQLMPDPKSHAVRLPPPDTDTAVIVHHQSGGGRKSRLLLPRIRVTSHVAQTITEMAGTLPNSYAAIHIRATDYTTDYEDVLRRLVRRERKLPVVVCSDNPEVLAHARVVLGHDRVISFPDDTGVPPGTPLHKAANYSSAEAKRRSTLALLRDIYVMSGATHFYYAPVDQRGKFGEIRFSGLSEFVSYLHANQQLRASFFHLNSPSAEGPDRRQARVLAAWPIVLRLAYEARTVKKKKRGR